MADIFGIGNIIGAGVTAAANYGTAVYNNEEAAQRERDARQENFQYGEKAAENADARTRALYNDLYSPQAQLEQLKAAGLSPSLFYGDGGGISGQAGAQGTGAAGISPNVFGAQAMDFTAVAKQIAETNLIKAQTKKTESETTGQDLENEVKSISNETFRDEMVLLRSVAIDENGQMGSSLYEIANDSWNYDQFLGKVREMYNSASYTEGLKIISSEVGQKILRGIYEANAKLERDIKVLSNEGVDADFQKSLAKALNEIDYANKNANAIAAEFEKQVEAANLEKSQREAWNNIINKLKAKNSDASDWVIVIGMILDRALTNYVSMKANLTRQ